MNADRYVSENQVSEITGFSLSKLRQDRIKSIGIPFVRVGRSVRYRLQDVIDFMESRKVQTRYNRTVHISEVCEDIISALEPVTGGGEQVCKAISKEGKDEKGQKPNQVRPG
jgi:predicted DNA-binding transcriptional regulator AlpA